MVLKAGDKKTLTERIERAVVATVGDLRLLVSLYTARAIVWLTLRRREREWAKAHAARRRQFGPAPGVRGADKNSCRAAAAYAGAVRDEAAFRVRAAAAGVPSGDSEANNAG